LNVDSLPREIEKKLERVLSRSIIECDDLKPLFHFGPRASSVHFIIIDGVDECTEHERKILFRTLNDIATTSTVAIKILISSRNEIPRETELDSKLWGSIQLDLQQVSFDIGRYVENKLCEGLESGGLIIGSPGLIQEVQNTLVNGANGM
jgi:hypothetical protein